MRKKLFSILIFSLLTLLALSACSLSLAQDVPPPPGYQPPVYEEPELLTGAAPEVVPNPENGKLIYAQKCEACHGSTGLGDGPDSTSLPNEVARIGSANVVDLASPLAWYSVTLQGNIDQFMPPFSGSLSPADVWDVLAYVYTFRAAPETVAQGEAVFMETCAACHGEDGSGSGMPGAANLLDADRMVLLSVEDIVQKAATGSGNDDHVFSNQLDAAEIESAALYVRSLLFPLEGEAVEPDAEETAIAEEPDEDGTEMAEEPADSEELVEEVAEEAESGFGIITGQVTNGSSGDLASGLEVSLEVYENFEQIHTDTVISADDGSYQFDDVLMDPALVYITFVEMDGVFFPSEFQMGVDTTSGTVDLPITVYDATTDTSGLTVSRLHAFFQFTDAGSVQVIHQVSISNLGTEVVAPQRDTEAVLNFTVPEGASNLIFQSGAIGNPYITTVTGFADPTPIMPGMSSYEILFAYDLPFDRNLDWQLPLDLQTDVAVIFVEGEAIKLGSDTLELSGSEVMEESVFQVMIGEGFVAGETIDVELTSPLFDGGGESLTQNRWFTIGLGIVGLGLAGFGAWRFFAPVSEEDEEDEEQEADQEKLVNEIVTLDEKFEAGSLEKDDYQEAREKLKAELRSLIEKEDAA